MIVIGLWLNSENFEVRTVSILLCIIRKTYQSTLNILGTKATSIWRKIKSNVSLTMVNDDNIINLFTNSTSWWSAHYVQGIVFHVIWNLALRWILPRNFDFLIYLSAF